MVPLARAANVLHDRHASVFHVGKPAASRWSRPAPWCCTRLCACSRIYCTVWRGLILPRLLCRILTCAACERIIYAHIYVYEGICLCVDRGRSYACNMHVLVEACRLCMWMGNK